MTLKLKQGARFKKDYRRIKRQNLDLTLLFDIVKKLLKNENLDNRFHDHQLTGKLKKYRDCHIAPDLILLYSQTNTELTLIRIGSHSEIFK